MKQSASTISLVTVLLVVTICAQARAQEAPTFNPEQVPTVGRSPQDFQPRGWKIRAHAQGDLNGDRVTDHVLQLIPEGYDPTVTGAAGAAPEAQALLLLLSAGGRLRRAGIATKLLVPSEPQYILKMSITKGVLVLYQNFGFTRAVNLTHRLRYEPRAGRFLLIGKEIHNYHRPEGPRWPATRISENYLTGVRLTITDHWLRNGTNRPRIRRERIASARIFVEDVEGYSDN
jgi:hypothetical protein